MSMKNSLGVTFGACTKTKNCKLILCELCCYEQIIKP